MSETPEEPTGPRRVIGTPSPAPKAVDTPTESEQPAFSAEPENVRHAKNAERLVAALFVLAFLAGCGFIAAYIGLEIGTATIPPGANPVVAVLRSNLGLGISLSVALLALGTGSIIWVRHLTPNIEIAEERHELRSEPEERKAFQREFAEGAAISQVTRRPLVRRTLLLATAPPSSGTSPRAPRSPRSPGGRCCAARCCWPPRRWRSRRSCCCATSGRCRRLTCGTRCGGRACAR